MSDVGKDAVVQPEPVAATKPRSPLWQRAQRSQSPEQPRPQRGAADAARRRGDPPPAPERGGNIDPHNRPVEQYGTTHDLPPRVKALLERQRVEQGLNDYVIEQQVKLWKEFVGNENVTPDVLRQVERWEPQQILDLLSRDIRITELQRLLPQHRDFMAVMSELMHVYREDMPMFQAQWQKLENLLESQPPEMRDRILGMDRHGLRGLLLKPGETAVHRIAGLKQEDIWVLKMLQATPDQMRIVEYNQEKMREKLKPPTYEKFMRLPAAARFDILLNGIDSRTFASRVDPTELLDKFDKKDVWRMMQILTPARPTESDIAHLPSEQQRAARETLAAWDREIAARRSALDETHKTLLDGLLANPRSGYREARGRLMKMDEFHRDRVLLILNDLDKNFGGKELDQRDPATIEMVRQKLAILQRLVPPEDFYPLLEPVVAKPGELRSNDAHFATLSEIVHVHQRGVNVFTQPLIGFDSQYHVPIYERKGNSLLIAQPGGGKSSFMRRLMKSFSDNPHGEQRGDLDKERDRQRIIDVITGRRSGEIDPPIPTSFLIIDSKAGEMYRTMQEVLSRSHDVRLVSFDNPNLGQHINPLAYIPRINGVVEQLRGQLDALQKEVPSLDTPQRMQDLQARIAATSTPEAIQARNNEQQNAAQRFVDLWMSAIDPKSLEQASINFPDLEKILKAAMKAAVLHLRETEPQAPLSRLASIVRTPDKSFFQAILDGKSQAAKDIVTQELQPLNTNFVENGLMPFLRSSTRTFLIPSIDLLTSSNEMGVHDLINHKIALFLQFDYQRFTRDDVMPVERLMTGMMGHAIAVEKTRRVAAGLYTGSNVRVFLEELGVLRASGAEPWDQLVRDLGITRDPAGLEFVAIGQTLSQLDPKMVSAIAKRYFTNIAPEDGQPISEQLGMKTIWVDDTSIAEQEGNSDKYSHTEHAIGLNANTERALNHEEMTRRVRGKRAVIVPLMTGDEVGRTFGPGHILLTQTGLSPLHLVVPNALDENNPMNLGFIDENPIQRTGMVPDDTHDPNREVWGRGPGQYVPVTSTYGGNTDIENWSSGQVEGRLPEATRELEQTEAQVEALNAQVMQQANAVSQEIARQAIEATAKRAELRAEIERLERRRDELKERDRDEE